MRQADPDVRRVRFSKIGEMPQNVVSSRSRKITVNAAIKPYSVAVKPFSFFSSRRKRPNILSPITVRSGETECELRLTRLTNS